MGMVWALCSDFGRDRSQRNPSLYSVPALTAEFMQNYAVFANNAFFCCWSSFFRFFLSTVLFLTTCE